MQQKSLIWVMCCLLVRATVAPNALLCVVRDEGIAMKRIPSKGSNEQEGREFIPAQSNGEEEAPLGLSFDGGVAGLRTYSRRQALGLLGGSLAGATLLSCGLADPAKSTHVPGHPTFRNFDHITLESVGGYLDGRIQDGTVGLAPHTNPPFTGTRWKVHADLRWDGAKYVEMVVLESLGHVPGNRLLVARRAPDTPAWSLQLAPVASTSSGRFWTVRQLAK
jgi:hypothetical protein